MGDLGCARGIAANTEATLIERTGGTRRERRRRLLGGAGQPENGGDNRECDACARSWLAPRPLVSRDRCVSAGRYLLAGPSGGFAAGLVVMPVRRDVGPGR